MTRALSPRERDCLRLVADGLENAQIAAQLAIRVPTVKTHLALAYAKLGAINRAHAAALAVREGCAS